MVAHKKNFLFRIYEETACLTTEKESTCVGTFEEIPCLRKEKEKYMCWNIGRKSISSNIGEE